MTKKKKPNLAQLRAKWRLKLKESGFDDIEDAKGNLKNFDANRFFVRYEPTTFESIERYYQLANIVLESARFSNILEKSVWRLHTEGLTYREIQEKLDITLYQIGNIVTKYDTLISKGAK